MNEDILKGQWSQLKGRVRQEWGRFTNDDVARIEGDREILLGRLQELYGRTREEAEEELEQFLSAEPRPRASR
ncbi:MAG TPA: CsbD family protein [Vicinamibacteria bacterium]|jgi:uncharacterized protein YjbJ (UPF0337 family)